MYTQNLCQPLLYAIVFLLSTSFFPLQALPTTGLVHHWSGEGNALDSSGNDGNGVLNNGVGFVPGQVGQAFSFNGSSFVSFPDSSFGQAPTLGLWINTTVNSQSIIDGGPTFFTWRIELTSDGRVTYRHFRNGTGGFVTITGSSVVTDGTFHHILTQVDNNNKTLKLFVDGVLEATYLETATSFTSWASAAGGDPKLGKSDTKGLTRPLFYTGLADELVLYNQVLSETEVQQVFEAGLIPEINSFLLLGGAMFVVFVFFRRKKNCFLYKEL